MNCSVKVNPVILCGGAGTRLWPLSTDLQPKQFLKLTDTRSMIATTAARVRAPNLFLAPKAVGSLRYEAQLRAELPDAKLILEPFGRDSAAAVAAAVLTFESDDIVLILPADHSIQNEEAFRTAIKLAIEAANRNYLVTFGIIPTYPATQYGYIKRGQPEERFFTVDLFKEKPSYQDAHKYQLSGQHYWNAGIFLFKASAMIEAFRKNAPDILDDTERALKKRGSDFILTRSEFADVRKQSVDYAVMEKAPNVAVVPVDMEWSDIGDFKSLAEHKRDKSKTISEGPVLSENCEGALLYSDGPTLAVRGLDDAAVIISKGSVLVAPLSEISDIKDLVARAKSEIPKEQIPQDQLSRLLDWLFKSTLPHWLDHGHIEEEGFVEALDGDGQPLALLKRRGRTMPRKIFAWSEALRSGFDPDQRVSRLVKEGIKYLEGCASSLRAVGHAGNDHTNGGTENPPLSFYDQSFVALAACSVYRSTQLPEAGKVASEIFDLIDQIFWDDSAGGWNENVGNNPKKLANPHMHYLEACLVHYEISYSEGSKRRIHEICELFEQHMFDARSGAVIETFDSDWKIEGPREKQKVEPGHCYEWAFLLKEVERLTGRDLGSWRRRLIAFAEGHGLDDDGKAHDWVCLDGYSTSESFRLWPQLERLRAIYSHPSADSSAKLSQIIDQIWDNYLDGNPEGVWADKIDRHGTSLVDNVPASMVYHLMTALTPLI